MRRGSARQLIRFAKRSRGSAKLRHGGDAGEDPWFGTDFWYDSQSGLVKRISLVVKSIHGSEWRSYLGSFCSLLAFGESDAFSLLAQLLVLDAYGGLAMSDHEFYSLSSSENSHGSDVAASSENDEVEDYENIFEGRPLLTPGELGRMAWANEPEGSPMDLDEAAREVDGLLGNDYGATRLGSGNHGIGKSMICIRGVGSELQVGDDDEDEGDGASHVSLLSALFDPAVATFDMPAGPDGGASLCTDESVISMLNGSVGFGQVTAFKPEANERVQIVPEGFVCLYEPFFTECGLRFPVPSIVTQYCARRAIALSQLSVAAIRNMVGLLILGAKSGIEIDVELLEAATVFSSPKNNAGLCNVNALAGRKICDYVTSKVPDWRRRYFFVKVDMFSFEEHDCSYATQWNYNPEHPNPKVRKDKKIRKKLDKIWALGSLNWPVVIEHTESCPPPCPIMGKPNCTFVRYADQLVKSGAPSDATPISVDAGEPSRGEQVVGARGGVRMTQGASRTVDTATDVAAARAAKTPVVEAGGRGTSSTPSPRRGGPSRLPPSGDASRKRSSRESSAVDPSAVPEGLGLGPEGADYRFSYTYPSRGVALELDSAECAKLASKIRGGFSEFPSPHTLSEANSYSSWTQEQFKSIGAGNRMVVAYEERLKKAEKAESDARDSFARERKKSDLYRKDLDKSTAETKSLKEKFDAETARLRASRDSWAKAEKERGDGYRVYGDRLRRHILSEEAAKKDLQMLAQVTGLEECLEELAGTGVPIPEETMKRVAGDKVKYQALVNQFDIVDLLEGDLEERATVRPTGVMADGTVGPSQVAADGGDRAPAGQ